MLWLSLHLNGLPLEAWLATAPDRSPATAARPCCVVEARCVVQADAAAAAAGIEPGMSAATAASLLSGEAGLQVFTRDLAREAAQIERLALTLARFTPAVVPQPDGVLLEVAASLRLFGGARALWRAVRDAAEASGVRSLRMAAAPTATAAAVLARVEPPSLALRRLPRGSAGLPQVSEPPGATKGPLRGPGGTQGTLRGPGGGRREAVAWGLSVRTRLDALPLTAALAAWGIDASLGELLHGIGCRTLGDVRMLPRAGLQRRGAAALLDAIARAHGEAPDPQPWIEPPRTFEMGLELMHRADDAAMLVFAVQRLVQPLVGWLAQQWLAAARLTLVLRHETSLRHAEPDTQITLALGDPTRDASQLMLLLRERLQRTALAAPVYALMLRLDQAVNHAGREAALWREAGRTNGEDAHALFDRLAARLGPEHVQRPRLVADHRPERAIAWAPARDAPGHHTPIPAPLSTLPPRPAWLLPEPLRLAEDPAQGRPLHQGVPLALTSRAERIEAGWFDGELVCRDYHVAQARDRRCLWVFRERRGAQSHWYLHGFFG